MRDVVVFLCVVVARAGAATNTAESRNARLARTKSIAWIPQKMKVPGRCSKFYVNVHVVCHKNGWPLEECKSNRMTKVQC